MENKVVLLLGILSCPLLVLCKAADREYVALEKGIDSLTSIVVKYQSEFDTKVKFAVLGDAIQSIDRSMLGYQGTAKNHLNEIRQVKSDTYLTYQDCVGPVLEWCVAINSTMELASTFLIDQRTIEHDKKMLWNMTIKALSSAIDKSVGSLHLLDEVQSKVSKLKNLLDIILKEMHEDFGSEGYYGKQKLELQTALEKKNKNIWESIIAVIKGIFEAVVDVVKGKKGDALKLLPVFAEQGLSLAINFWQKATISQQLEVIKLFFRTLDEKINEARNVALHVKKDSEVDYKNLVDLSNLINNANRNNELLLSANPNTRGELVPKLRALGHQCYEYVLWHDYESVGYAQKHSRVKRGVMEPFENKVINKLIHSLLESYNFKMIASKASAIINQNKMF